MKQFRRLSLVGTLLLVTATLACSGNGRISVGGSIYLGSGGGWGHGLSIGIHAGGR